MSSGPDLVSLFGHLADLKRLKRTGWLDRGVPPAEVESVADHSLLTAVISWVVACDDTDIDASRVLQLAVIHDLAESISGDPAPYDPADVPIDDPEALAAFFSVRHPRSLSSSDTKQRAEAAAVEKLISLMPDSAARSFRELWNEYESQETTEARFVKQVDRLEAFLQSRDYVDRYPNLPFDGFRLQALEEITHPVLARVRDERLERSGESRVVLE
jgi:5'-deoxynucleotidase YfbR-like HD superfamily hydrolase